MTTETERSRPVVYGFDPDTEYVIRARVWNYQGVTERFRFANGQATAPRMRHDAIEGQIIARAERLSRLRDARGRITLDDSGHPLPATMTYRIYVRGEEPPVFVEPMWQGQSPPEGAARSEDTGEGDPTRWRAEQPSDRQRPPKPGEDLSRDRTGGASVQVAEGTAAIFPEDLGEDSPQATVTVRRWEMDATGR